MDGRNALLIAGPTASGKSALALWAAQRFGGTIINADSSAVYADLSILTGRPRACDIARAPHVLYGHRDGAQAYSVGVWLAEAAREILRTREAGRLPIIVGGTGLFFKALTQGLSDIPAVPDAVRSRLRAEAQGIAPAALHARLAALDPLTAARLRPTDPQRILRALEVHAATGRPLAEFHGQRAAPVLTIENAVGIVLLPERDSLRAAIDARFDDMMADGALEEVARLAARGLDPALPVMRALGVPPLLAHLAGALSIDAAVSRAKAETRAYAKRQSTFTRHQLQGFSTVGAKDGAEALRLAFAT